VNQILIVEDEPDMAATYERLLRRAGHRVVTVASRVDGMRLLESLRPWLVISDIRLPDGDGLDIIRAAQKLDLPPAVIAITAFTSRETRQAALDAGANAFLAKPFGIAEFSSLVEDLIKRRKH
jgi:two-component system, OmpR family, KDP operon response regulator KdpE